MNIYMSRIIFIKNIIHNEIMEKLVEHRLCQLYEKQSQQKNFDITDWNENLVKKRNLVTKKIENLIQLKDKDLHFQLESLLQQSLYKIKVIQKLEKIFLRRGDFSTCILDLLLTTFECKNLAIGNKSFIYSGIVNKIKAFKKSTSADQKDLRKNIFNHLVIIVKNDDTSDLEFLREIIGCFDN